MLCNGSKSPPFPACDAARAARSPTRAFALPVQVSLHEPRSRERERGQGTHGDAGGGFRTGLLEETRGVRSAQGAKVAAVDDLFNHQIQCMSRV